MGRRWGEIKEDEMREGWERKMEWGKARIWEREISRSM